jgi:hypothetical protein
MFEDKKYIFKYDPDDNLYEYIEKDDSGNLSCAYNFNGTILKKVYYNYNDHDTLHKEVKSVIEYPPGCIMHHTFFDGTSHVVVRKKNGDYVAPIRRIEKYDGNYIGYTIKEELLTKWKKIKNESTHN